MTVSQMWVKSLRRVAFTFLLVVSAVSTASAQLVLSELRTELDTDPTGALAAAGLPIPVTLTDDHALAAATLNDRADPSGSSTIDHNQISSRDVRGAVVPSDYQSLNISEAEWMAWVSGIETIAITSDVKSALTTSTGEGIWQVGNTATMSALLALIEFTGSRIEVLFGEGIRITASDVANALRLP